MVFTGQGVNPLGCSWGRWEMVLNIRAERTAGVGTVWNVEF